MGSEEGMHCCSPVPYLFAGMAAMILLISVALGILLCSSWKVSVSSLSASLALSATSTTAAATSASGADMVLGPDNIAAGYESNHHLDLAMPKIVVVMAGDQKPTFLAMPTSVPL